MANAAKRGMAIRNTARGAVGGSVGHICRRNGVTDYMTFHQKMNKAAHAVDEAEA